MSKSFIVLAIVALTCVSALHLQSFAPSKPGGTYYGANGTQSTPAPNNNYQPAPAPYNNNNYQPAPAPYNPYNNNNYQPAPNNQYNNNQYTNTQTSTGIFVNGQPYAYTGPFRLVCYQQNSTNIFRQDTCNSANTCANILNEYRNCLGTVKKFPV